MQLRDYWFDDLQRKCTSFNPKFNNWPKKERKLLIIKSWNETCKIFLCSLHGLRVLVAVNTESASCVHDKHSLFCVFRPRCENCNDVLGCRIDNVRIQFSLGRKGTQVVVNGSICNRVFGNWNRVLECFQKAWQKLTLPSIVKTKEGAELGTFNLIYEWKPDMDS